MEDEQYKRSLAGVSNLGWNPNDPKEELKDVINKLSNKLSIAEKALEFYASQERETERLHQELIKKSNTAIELQFYSNVPCIARQALAVIRGEIKNY